METLRKELVTPHLGVEYCYKPVRVIDQVQPAISSFVTEDAENIDWETVESFGDEWTKFSNFSEDDLSRIGDDYFDIVSQAMLNSDCKVLDVGCGTGRWTKYVAGRSGFVESIDPSRAVFAASRLLANLRNVRITQCDVGNMPFKDESFDFVFSLGVLHHIPDTRAAMQSCVDKLKKGGHFLVYLYYNLDNKGMLNRALFHSMNTLRRGVCRLPAKFKRLTCDLLAAAIYLPNAWATHLLKILFKGDLYKRIPLAYYHDKSFQIMRNDALDRFGTPLEQRFSKAEIVEMMQSCGLTEIVVSPERPYWHAVGKKA